MMILTHLLFGLAFGLITRYPTVFLIGSILPDIDLLLGQVFPLGHRNFFHSIAFAVIAGLALYAWKKDEKMGLIFSSGILGHILLDMFTFQSIEFLYPLQFGFSLDWIHTKNLIPNIALWVLYPAFSLLWWKFSEKIKWKYKNHAATIFLLISTLLIVWISSLADEWLLII